ncbi:tetratricopeptide repeat protein [Chryseobacterium salivictor]|uniref:Uncharacterized protein n=1 Tax=Chryseobacterium salivictor TaxID=2547600 RepID=A0A4P6ZFS6_9FLAO|nr:hypothetical protein [Chryseobacterium salivictor]QBO58418.1 hypothetical protein NBC122_01603 [Chryseobacterium salivictor]
MEKLSIFSRILLTFKILFSVLFLGFISLAIFFVYVINKEAKFAIGAGTQGTQFSQFIFAKLIKDFPTYSDAFFEKSVPYNKRGFYYEGFQLLNRAVDLNPKEHLGYRGWIKLNKLKDYQGAIKDFEKLDSLTPNYFDVNGGSINYLLAAAYQGAGNFEKSRTFYEKLFKADEKQYPIFPISYVNYGILLGNMGLHRLAIKQFDISLNKSNYKFAESYYNKALIYKKLGEKDSVQILLKRALDSYDQGYKINDIYNEAFNELYRDDIIRQIE